MNKEWHKNYYENNKGKWDINTEEKKERKRQNQKAYMERNKEKLDEKRKQWAMDNYEWEILNNALRTSKIKGYEFNLELSDIVIPELCPYLQIPLTKIRGKGVILSNASIDRLDNTKGYIKGNIQIISRQANTMKSNSTKEQLVAFAKGVIAMHSKEVELL